MANTCPKCNKPLNKKVMCSSCNITIKGYKKIINSSKLLYNIGLQKAKSRDLSGSIELLTRSIKLDKHNIDARNLLGLVYLEIGETVLALQQWVVSRNLQPESNMANDYLKRVQDSQSNLERLNSAIKKYNQALAYINQGSLDLAMIQLKKILTTNHNFIKAYCLLSLLYIKEDEPEKAKKELLKALTIDKGNFLVLKYLDELNISTTEAVVISPEKEVKTERMRARRQIVINQSVQQFMGVIFGLALGVALIVFLIMPNKINEKNTLIEEKDSALKIANESIQVLSMEKEANTQKIENLQLDLENALNENAELSTKDAKVQKLMLTMNEYLADNIVGAAGYLESIDISDSMDGVLNSLYEQLAAIVYKEAALDTYVEGKAAYDKADYVKAIEVLETCILYTSDENFADDAVYYLGRSYQFTEKPKEALEKFNYLVATYPTSNLLEYAKRQITNLGGN